MSAADFFSTVEDRFHDWRYDHPKVLYGLIRSLKPEVVVEVGTYRGYAACYMARAIQENNTGRLYCVDNFSLDDHAWKYGDPEQHWSDNLTACGVRDWVTLLRGDSSAVRWPDEVDFAYIDGWHSYSACKADAEKCAARGAECIAFDDVLTTVGPRKYFQELSESAQWDTVLLQRDGGLGIAYRRAPLRRVEFIQEVPGELGTVLHGMTDAEVDAEVARASAVTGIDYGTRAPTLSARQTVIQARAARKAERDSARSEGEG